MDSGHWLYVAKGAQSATWQAARSSGKKMTLDLRSTGMQTVFPPSVHESGEPIRWLEEGEPRERSEDDLKRACARLAAAVLTLRLYVTKARNMFVGPFTGWLRKGGMTAEDTTDFIMKVVHASGDDEPRNREDYIRRTNLKFDNERGDVSGHSALVEMGCDASTLTAIGKWLGLQHKSGSLDVAVRCTDSGNAQYLIEKHGDKIQYCPSKGSWFVWNGRYWQEDSLKQFMNIVKRTVRELIDEVNRDRGAHELLKWATQSLNKRKLDAMEALARPEVSININAFDVDPWLLSVDNGTINLKTGELLAHDPEHFITKIIPIVYNPNAKCLRWEQFVSEIMCGNEELVRFLQRAIGYSLTGLTLEQCFFILYGLGANGKGVLIRILKQLLQEYFYQADFKSFIQRDVVSGEIRSDLAALAGRRLVAASEANQKARIDEALLKQLTGEDSITSRFLRRENFTYEPTFKIWLSTNYKPEIRGLDEGMWRRLKLIPFEASFREGSNKRDPLLVQKLTAELPGILAWAVRGCLEWQHDGLRTPDCVRNATDEYRAQSDILHDFWEECIVTDPQACTRAADILGAYKGWCMVNRQTSVKSRTFGEILQNRGIQKKNTRREGVGGLHYLGIALTDAGKERLRHCESAEMPF
jgi:putative DNA primase/helicase